MFTTHLLDCHPTWHMYHPRSFSWTLFMCKYLTIWHEERALLLKANSDTLWYIYTLGKIPSTWISTICFPQVLKGRSWGSWWSHCCGLWGWSGCPLAPMQPEHKMISGSRIRNQDGILGSGSWSHATICLQTTWSSHQSGWISQPFCCKSKKSFKVTCQKCMDKALQCTPTILLKKKEKKKFCWTPKGNQLGFS